MDKDKNYDLIVLLKLDGRCIVDEEYRSLDADTLANQTESRDINKRLIVQ